MAIKKPTDKKINETAALDTLKKHDNGGIDPSMTKSQIMAMAQKMMSTMSDSDLISFFNASLDAIGDEAKGVPEGAAGKNAATIKAHNVKEEISKIMDGLDLSEDVLDKITTLFEAAVTISVLPEIEKAREEIQAESDKAFQESMSEAVDEINEYLDKMADTWMENNALVVDNNIKVAITESFIDGMKNLFKEHYVEIPEDKADVVADLSDMVESLQTELNAKAREVLQLSTMVEEILVSNIVESMSKDLTETQKEKFKSLSENVRFDPENVDKFKEKLSMIKENFIMDKKTVAAKTIKEETGLEETVEGKKNLTEAESDPFMQAYLNVFKRTES